MARHGRAGVALTAAAIGSFFAGTVATFLLALFAPPLTEIALKFGPADYFSLMILGLIASVVLAQGSLLHAIGMVVLGLLLGLIGTDVPSGTQRFTFDIPELVDITNLMPTKDDWKRMVAPILRGPAIGSALGHPARERLDPRLVRGLLHREEGLEAPGGSSAGPSAPACSPCPCSRCAAC